MGDVEERLKLLDQVANGAGLDGLLETLNGIVGNDLTRLDETGHEGLEGVSVRLADDGSKSEDGLGLHICGIGGFATKGKM